MISKFVPAFVNQGIIDHDYTMLAMRRYAESSRYFWAGFIKKVKAQNASIVELISQFQKAELKEYKAARRTFEAAQARYDYQLGRYLGYAKTKEPSALREDAFQLAEARTAYVKASYDMCTSISLTAAKLDICLVKALSEPYILPPKEFALADTIPQKISVEMLRLRSWAKSMSKSYKPLTKEMEKAAKEMEHAAIERLQPSRDIDVYSAQNSTISHFVPEIRNRTEGLDEKHGWLFIKSSANKGVRQVWVRRWVFVKNGMFGWLNISPSRTFVQESDKIGVLLCHVTPVSSEDRRFCFEIKTTDTVLILQAETLEEMRSWLQVFEDAKRLAIESDKKTTISYASQRFPPMISEFATTAGTSVDVELTSEKPLSPNDYPSDYPSIGSSISLFKTPEASNLLALMTAGESLETPTNNGVQGKVAFSSVGPFGAALAPSPLLNIPMPTSMTQEAILSNSFVMSSAIPSAITANYWGSVNWASYQNNTTIIRDPSNSIHEKVRRSSSMLQLKEESYPSYYPSELRSQDVQLRAIFQNLAGNSINDKVVLVFRCLVYANPHQQVPARLYITQNTIYMYSHSLGMTSTLVIPMNMLISVEGRSGLQHDTLFLISSQGTTSCNVYLDSRRLLQKRIQFLIDNHRSEHPLNLEKILEHLQALGSDQKVDENDEGDFKEDITPDISVMEAIINDEKRTDTEKKFLYHYIANYMSGTTTDSTAHKPKESADNESIHVVEPDMSKLMSQMSGEHEFDIPPKALFHVMFGETSPVFRYDDSGSVVRSNIEFAPWRLVNTQRMEREIYFQIKQSSTFFASENDKLMYVQRLEVMDDNSAYVIYERRNVYKLPQGDSFYTTFRYVISRTPTGSSKLKIWSSVEWVKSSLIKNMTEPFVLTKLKTEAKIIVNRTIRSRKQLGSKGGIITAIRLFGKIGSSAINKTVEGVSLEANRSVGETKPDENLNSIIVSHKSIGISIWEASASFLISFIGEVFLILRKIIMGVWAGITSNKILILGLILSFLFNFFLMGFSTTRYWMERHARQYADDLVFSSHSYPIMSRSILLKDIDMLIKNGSRFSVEAAMAQEIGESASNSLCYNKFKSLALLPELAQDSYVFTDDDDYSGQMDFSTLYLDDSSLGESTQGVRNRIFNIRSKLGIKRNNLMVELRSISTIESELVMAEWQSWLYKEVSLCTRLTQGFIDIKEGKGSGTKSARNSHEEKLNMSLAKMFSEASVDTKTALTRYCQSCTHELKSTIGSA